MGSPNRLCAALFGLMVVLIASTQPAFASPGQGTGSAAERAEYRRAIRDALEEFNAGNFPEARGLFTRAHQLYPNARTFRGLGFVAFELRNYRECVEFLEAALSTTERPLSDALRVSTEELLERARAMIARVRVDVSPAFESMLVDGVPVEPGPEQTLVLQVGDHTLEVRAPGYVSERRALRIAGGEALDLKIQLAPLASAEQAPGPRIAHDVAAPSPREDKPNEKRWYKNPWLWTGVAVVLVGAGVGTYFALSRDPGTRTQDPTTTPNTPAGGVVRAWRTW